MSQVDAKVEIVTGDAPMPPSADTELIGTGNEESGLWLWHGEALPPPSLAQPKSRVGRILAHMVPAARWAGWIALPSGLAVALLVVSVMMHSPRPDKPVPADAPAVPPQPLPSPAATPPIIPAPPMIPAPLTEPTADQSGQVQVPSAPTAQMSGRRPEHDRAKWHAQRTSPPTARKTHASVAHRGSPVMVPGVLTPPMTWHGGGY